MADLLSYVIQMKLNNALDIIKNWLIKIIRLRTYSSDVHCIILYYQNKVDNNNNNITTYCSLVISTQSLPVCMVDN